MRANPRARAGLPRGPRRWLGAGRCGRGIALAVVATVLSVGCRAGAALSGLQTQLRVALSRQAPARSATDPRLDAHQRAMLALVPAIQAFGVAQGLAPTRDHQRLSWGLPWPPHVLVSAPPLSPVPHTVPSPAGPQAWSLHSSPRSLLREARRREALGHEVHHRPAGAWTSWGPLRDPLLPEMLALPLPDLAETLLHEQVHGTAWLGREPVLAERIAGFVGKEAARRFLVHHLGPDSPALAAAETEAAERDRWAALLAGVYDELQAILRDPATSPAEKRAARARLFASLHQRVARAGFADPDRFHAAVAAGPWTTPRLLEHQAYRDPAPALPSLLDAHGGDLGALLQTLRAWHGCRALAACLATPAAAACKIPDACRKI